MTAAMRAAQVRPRSPYPVPARASTVTSRTPVRPRAVRSAEARFRAAPVAAVATRRPRVSRFSSLCAR